MALTYYLPTDYTYPLYWGTSFRLCPAARRHISAPPCSPPACARARARSSAPCKLNTPDWPEGGAQRRKNNRTPAPLPVLKGVQRRERHGSLHAATSSYRAATSISRRPHAGRSAQHRLMHLSGCKHARAVSARGVRGKAAARRQCIAAAPRQSNAPRRYTLVCGTAKH